MTNVRNMLVYAAGMLVVLFVLVHAGGAQTLNVSSSELQVRSGGEVTVRVTETSGRVSVRSSNTNVAVASYDDEGVITVRGRTAGSATLFVWDRESSRRIMVTVSPEAMEAALTAVPASIQVQAGGTAYVSVTNAVGEVMVSSSSPGIVTVSYDDGIARIMGHAAGTATVTVRDSRSSSQVAATVSGEAETPEAGDYTLLAWNNLGMHCYDGNDYSIFSILPPLNTLNAQLVNKVTGRLVTRGVTLTYEATADTKGSINTVSSTKTNFWQYAQSLFGLAPKPDVGLLGYPMASHMPATMAYNAEHNWFEAVGIPITNVDDSGAKNDYPMVKVVAKNSDGEELASTKVVLPVSDMLDCRSCHASNNDGNAAQNAAMPAAGWVFDPDHVKDWKKNILRLHDERQAGNSLFAAALQAKGYPDGLYNSAVGGKPVLCVACHFSNVYQLEAGTSTGMVGIPPLTQAAHGFHAGKLDPATGMTLDHINNRSACYLCHPGSVTQCLRGAMSGPNYQCQSCHGRMSHVGSTGRSGWLDLPNCQACHHDGKRELVGVDNQGLPLLWSDTRFATTPNVPGAGTQLYRFSIGHGGLKCPACHGSTHAEYPSREPNDNIQSIAVQGYAGTVRECSACHDSVPDTVAGGPHGMHPTGDEWMRKHDEVAVDTTARMGCASCHGADFRGSTLSRVREDKTIGSYRYTAGQMVGCYDCHENSSDDRFEPARRFEKEDDSDFMEHVDDFFSELVSGVMNFLGGLRNRMFGA